jgi:mRNA-degrading endonuclease toxin of MazEF toxin-antitoxin module
MALRRGQVVLVDWPLARPAGSKVAKVRPALVVQNDRDNARLTNTILAMITSMTSRVLESTQLLVQVGTPEGQQTGLRNDSALNCINLLTVEQTRIVATIGLFSPAMMQKVNNCLKVALELP